MSNVKNVLSCSLYRCWKPNDFQVSPANTLIGSANERALDIPSRPRYRFILAVNPWSRRLAACRRQEYHQIDDRINEIPMYASLRRLLQMDTFDSGEAGSKPYAEPLSPWCQGRYKCAVIVRYVTTIPPHARVCL